ncbi:hypothetical protein RFI_38470 [Reticulomyxa filosa]|uniref:Uncharacterized protein n=1 Tax=Reticulomyxa filosa TaxID=46433 RepID=X6LBV8_RETFI|nr:hypothetical protein RFI_38470 [Reticulomyxa filosa]|eukprot:ETN99018.1 hypothetical protein RFI_38470 [Reticulomyxa filosa]
MLLSHRPEKKNKIESVKKDSKNFFTSNRKANGAEKNYLEYIVYNTRNENSWKMRKEKNGNKKKDRVGKELDYCLTYIPGGRQEGQRFCARAISRINFDEKNALTIGRTRINDIVVEDDIHISRIHCYLFKIKQSLVVLDACSLLGTYTLKRSTDSKCLHSFPNERHVLTFGLDETVHIRLGAYCHIILNPKTCVVCQENSRSVRTKCGHSVLCSECFDKLNRSANKQKRCPLCNSTF